MSILIADSGGTKTNWAYVGTEKVNYMSGKGLHPSYMTANQMIAQIKKLGKLDAQKVYFYGAGCLGKKPVKKVEKAFREIFRESELSISDDLTGAARALLQNTDGIIGALGTGSICGRYSSGQVDMRSASLGFAIGDEGSAADLGRLLLRAYFRETFNEQAHTIVNDRLDGIGYGEMMNRIYSASQPNRKLADIARKVFTEPLIRELEEIIRHSFTRFADRQLSMLSPSENDLIICTGAVAVAHADRLINILGKRGFKNVRVSENVIEGLVTYHTNKMSRT